MSDRNFCFLQYHSVCRNIGLLVLVHKIHVIKDILTAYTYAAISYDLILGWFLCRGLRCRGFCCRFILLARICRIVTLARSVTGTIATAITRSIAGIAAII